MLKFKNIMKKGMQFAFYTALVSGFSIFINKFGVEGLNPYLFTGFKNIIVAIFVFSTILLLKEFYVFKQLRKKMLNLILIGFFGGSIPFLLFFKGLQLTSAANAAFMHKTLFIYVSVLALIFLKEKLSKGFLIGAILLLIGNLLLLKINSFNLGLGDLLIFIATLFWAIETIISKRALKELSSRTVAFGRMFFGSLFILLFLLFTGNFSLIFKINLAEFSWIIITSLFLFLYVLFWYTALKFEKASVATSILLLGSVITSLLSYFFLDVALTLIQSIGILLLVSGVICITLLEFFNSKSKMKADLISNV